VTRVVCAAAILAVVAGAARADARTWTVGGRSADFPLIGPAIRAAADGDTIEIRRGVYREDLVIDRRLTLRGLDRPVLIGTGMGTVVEIRAAGVEVRGLVIEGSGTGLTNMMDAGVHVMGNGNRVADNVMRRVFYGVVVIDASDNEISGNDIEGLGDLPFGRRGDGVYAFRAPGTQIVRNRIGGMRDGIYFQHAPRGVAEANLVERSRYGLHDMFSDGARIAFNTFRLSSVGATVMNSTRVTILGNRFERNRGVASVGLTVKHCDDSLVEDNLIAGNARGALIDGSFDNRFVSNRFAFNDTAVSLFSSAERNVFVSNVFDRNWSDVVITGGGSDTRWSENGRGNWWSRYRGFDFDGDGVGEAPHRPLGLFEKLEGRQAAVRLFLHSPAALALDLTAGFAPVRQAVTDPFPLSAPGTGTAREAAGQTGPTTTRRAPVAGVLALVGVATILTGGVRRRGHPCFE
jgi:nitrous oxidase accessory protein